MAELKKELAEKKKEKRRRRKMKMDENASTPKKIEENVEIPKKVEESREEEIKPKPHKKPSQLLAKKANVAGG